MFWIRHILKQRFLFSIAQFWQHVSLIQGFYYQKQIIDKFAFCDLNFIKDETINHFFHKFEEFNKTRVYFFQMFDLENEISKWDFLHWKHDFFDKCYCAAFLFHVQKYYVHFFYFIKGEKKWYPEIGFHFLSFIWKQYKLLFYSIVPKTFHCYTINFITILKILYVPKIFRSTRLNKTDQNTWYIQDKQSLFMNLS